MFKNTFAIFLGLFFSLIEFSLFSQFENSLGHIFVSLVVGLYIFFFYSDRYSLVVLFTAAIFMDIFSTLPFGVFMILYTAIYVGVYFVSLYLFTNKSMYSWLTLLLLSILLFDISLFFSYYFSYLFNYSEWYFGWNLIFSYVFYTVVANIVFGLFLFVLDTLLQRRGKKLFFA